MARRTYTRPARYADMPNDHTFTNAAFLADLLAGRISATAMVEVFDGRGRRVRLDYEDPLTQAERLVKI